MSVSSMSYRSESSAAAGVSSRAPAAPGSGATARHPNGKRDTGHGADDRSRVEPMAAADLDVGRLDGLRRIARAYGISLLAAVLGLPGLAAGMISSNACRIRGYGCADRLSYGIIIGIAITVIIQLVMALHFKLGGTFWLVSTAISAVTAALGSSLFPVLVAGLVIAPGLAAWISDPPRQRKTAFRHWIPRLTALTVVPGVLLLVGLRPS